MTIGTCNNKRPATAVEDMIEGTESCLKRLHNDVSFSDVDEEDDIATAVSLEATTCKDSENYVKWQKTISKVVQSVVSIHFTQVSSFDSEPPLVSEATGFVVDPRVGIILTNRHVVGAGPFVGYAVFDNHEECDVTPIYRDPVHDFGFLKFDPSKVKYMKIQALELKPTLAKVGSEIRVVGNDAGEKLSILAGFISRIDRNAPEYGEMTYNDFNTEYIQAAASASGGSSGSPVVNIDGYAVALQAGGSTEASTDFFLPLDRVLRALKCVQNNQKITRGTIQTQFLLKPYEECRRLGLTSDREDEARKMFPEKIGLLVATTIIREGPVEGKMKEGDALISINGELISSFIQVDDIFDQNVDKEVDILVQRGGIDQRIKCTVGNLHDITPDRYVEVCGATFHELSYQMARSYALPVRGVFLCSASGSFDFDAKEKVGWIIDAIDNQETPNLDTFIDVMRRIPDRKRVTVRYHHMTDQHSPQVISVYIDRHWWKDLRVYKRNDISGIWDYTNVSEPLPAEAIGPSTARVVDIPISNPHISKLSHSLCTVTSICAVPIDSLPAESHKSSGLIIDAERGYVIVSRTVIPHDCLDVLVTIADSVMIPADIIFMHPTQNYAILKYDSALISASLVTPHFSTKRLKRGDKAHFVGYTFNNRVVTAETHVTDISSVSIPSNIIPRYRATNLEGIFIDCNVSTKCNSGVLADDDGTIRALWLSFLGERQESREKMYLMGLDITECLEVISILKQGKKPKVSIVDAEFGSLSILHSRIRGVPESWIKRMEDESENRVQFIPATRVSYTMDTVKLEAGDVILSVNDKLVKSMSDLDGIVAASDDKSIPDHLRFKVVRAGKPYDLDIRLVDVHETDQLVVFGGCLLQRPHHAVRQTMLNLPSEVYCTYRGDSSPAAQYGIYATNFITHVNEIPTPDLTSLLETIKVIPDNTYCKIRLVSFDNVPFAISLKTNYHYFPTGKLRRSPDTNQWIQEEFNN